MSNFDFVFKDYEEEKQILDFVPESGVYDLELTGWEGKTTKAGKPMVNWIFEIRSDDERVDGYTVFQSTVLDPNDRGASSFFYQTFINLAKERLNDFEGFNIDQVLNEDLPFFDDLVGEVITAQCEQDSYEGRKNLKIRRII